MYHKVLMIEKHIFGRNVLINILIILKFETLKLKKKL